ncbi:hypothetical protein [Chitinophaga sp. 212800010-3]|uniref:hypothetical protein n=1 Tax=unclassified Chitinophaga TaxID=2619133 RepID=UPI002DF1C6EA|nr:Lipoprotein [Chitinophaga sp. 212800010-3]
MRYLLFAALIWLLACHPSQKIYQAPAVGAEAQFDRGLRPEKHPKYLFDKKMMNDLKKQGEISSYTPKRHHTGPTVAVPGKGGSGKDSTAAATDSLHMGVDSLKAAQPLTDTARKLPADTTHVP